MPGPKSCSVSKCQIIRSVLADVFGSVKLPALASLVLAAAFAMLLVACGDEGESTTASSQGQPEATPTVEAMMEEATSTPVPDPSPVVLGDCRDGMRLQPGEGCRYTGGGNPQANVVLSVQHDGAICREGGPVKRETGVGTINVGSVRLCSSGGFERDDAFQSDIAARANADGSWTFYESELSASVPRSTASAAPTITPTAAPPLNVYESGQTIPDFPSGIPNVVRGGASLQMVGGNVVITMGNGGTVEYSHATYTCVSGEGCGIENGRVTTGTIQAADPTDVGSPTPIPTAAPQPTATPRPTATPTPEPTATPTATPVRSGRFSEFDGAGAAVWQRMHGSGQIVACYEGLALPRDSFCLSEGFRFTPDYSEILDTKFLVAHLPDGDAFVLYENTTSRAAGDIRLGWITFENRVITHLEFNASQASTPVATATPRPSAAPTPEPTATLPDPTKEPIIFSDLLWVSAQLQNRIAQYIIEHGYDYPTGVIAGATLPLLEGLQRGDTDVTMEVWLPNQDEGWNKARSDGVVLSVGHSLGSDWQSAFVIPAYLQQEYPDLDSVGDLKDPQFKELFQTAESGNKARLVSCVIGWACEKVNAAQIEGYGLSDHVHIVNPGSRAAVDADLYGAYEQQEPWLGYQWGTSDPALKLDLVRLKEPAYSDECWFTNKACAYEDSNIIIAVNSDLLHSAPDVVDMLRRWDFNLDVYKTVARWQDATGVTDPNSTAIWWLESNSAIWSEWVTAEAATSVRAALDRGDTAAGWPDR